MMSTTTNMFSTPLGTSIISYWKTKSGCDSGHRIDGPNSYNSRPTVGINANKFAFRNLPTFSSLQELTFQTVIDTILKPAGVKVGGFPQEMFIDLTEDEQQKWACNIWSVVPQNGIDQTIKLHAKRVPIGRGQFSACQ